MNKEFLDKVALFLGAQKSRLGVVSTVNSENKPESALVYFTFDEKLNIYFVTRDITKKYKNIIENKNVAFVVSKEIPPQTLQIEGVGSVHNNPEDQKDLYKELVGLASSKHFSPPVSQINSGGLAFIKISPTWIRFGNFEVRKHDNIFQQVGIEG